LPDASFAKLHDSMKEIAVKAVEATNPVKVLFGTVRTVDPLTVDIEQKLSGLTADFFIQTATLQGLQAGDKLVLLQTQGGQSFLILDKVVG